MTPKQVLQMIKDKGVVMVDIKFIEDPATVIEDVPYISTGTALVVNDWVHVFLDDTGMFVVGKFA